MFHDRVDAGRNLAAHLSHLRDQQLVVLGLPRGGVPVAAEVAREMGAPLDVIVVRKLGVPSQPELAMGAVGEGGVLVLNEPLISAAGIRQAAVAKVREREEAEVRRRAESLRRGHERLDLAGRVAVIVDDGIATGATATAACEVARAAGAREVVVAAPVAPPDAERRFRDVADSVVFVHTPTGFSGVGQFYEDFDQTSDEEVTELLAASRSSED